MSDNDPVSWFQLTVSVPASGGHEEMLDALIGRLWAPGAVGVEEREGALVATFEDLAAARAASELVEAAGPPLASTVSELGAEAVGRALDSWRHWATPVRIGRVALVPSWSDDEASSAPSELCVQLDPGRAFGSGSHASTRLAVRLLVDRVRPGDAVLDVGCGSGVLAVTAALVGASSAVAIDLDPEALRATVANAALNDVADRVSVSSSRLEDLTDTYDLVVANIDAPVLDELAPALVSRLGPGGSLVLSGMLSRRLPSLLERFVRLSPVEERHEDGWAGVVLQEAPIERR